MSQSDVQAPPRIIIGCWQLAAGHSESSERDRRELLDHLHRWFQAGFTTFDCADIYSGVEELLGEFRHECLSLDREAGDGIRIHTKFVPDRDRLARIDRQHVQDIIDRSLRRLRIERLDLVQFHWWDWATPGYVETASYLHELHTAGKIGRIGLTNFDVHRMAEVIDSGVPISSNQVQWSLLDQRPQGEFAAFAASRNVRVFCYGGLGGGFLSDKHLGAPPNEPLANRSLVKYRLIIDEAGGWEAFQSLLAALQAVGDRHGATIAEVSLAWLLSQQAVSSVIVGAGSSRGALEGEHITSIIRAGRLRLTAADRRDIAAALDALTPLSGEIYTLERLKSGPHAAIMRYNLNSQSPGFSD